MLVLSRKQNESIVVDGNIEITIVQCGKGKVKIGVEAPKHVSILRGELKPQCEAASESKLAIDSGLSETLSSYLFPVEAVTAGVGCSS